MGNSCQRMEDRMATEPMEESAITRKDHSYLNLSSSTYLKLDPNKAQGKPLTLDLRDIKSIVLTPTDEENKIRLINQTFQMTQSSATIQFVLSKRDASDRSPSQASRKSCIKSQQNLNNSRGSWSQKRVSFEVLRQNGSPKFAQK